MNSIINTFLNRILGGKTYCALINWNCCKNLEKEKSRKKNLEKKIPNDKVSKKENLEIRISNRKISKFEIPKKQNIEI